MRIESAMVVRKVRVSLFLPFLSRGKDVNSHPFFRLEESSTAISGLVSSGLHVCPFRRRW
jgi:hypothetical protein